MNCIVLQTSKGTPINTETYQDATYFSIKKKDEFYMSKHPHAILRRKGTRKYNCHGLTFANRRTCIEDSDDLLIILKDDEYRRISFNKVTEGDIIIYKYDSGDIEHTGIVIRVERFNNLPVPFILSKWAHCGEFIHKYNDCPYSIKKIEFWTDRK